MADYRNTMILSKGVVIHRRDKEHIPSRSWNRQDWTKRAGRTASRRRAETPETGTITDRTSSAPFSVQRHCHVL
jgi:hypothetical protein